MTKYQVSECIGRGGMAEVFLARQEGIGGFEKLVALKRIYPHLVHDENFIEMFLAEARIAASLQHPKIVQILDIESDADGFFIVMEYLAGEPLSYILSALEETGNSIPPQIACRIGSDIASGLHTAHTASDAEGQLRPVVHRDVTPSNILVTFSGGVKVLDFGVAKAKKREGTTDKGVLKGKTSYLSPELIAGDSIDSRADVFQLGVVVHEMLTGQQLFNRDTLPEIIKAISEEEIAPPSQLVPEVPESLDTVVMKALSRDPAERYQSADDLAHALDEEAAALGEPVSERMLGRWMHKTFPERVEQKRRWRQAALGRDTVIDDSETDATASDQVPSTEQPTVNERKKAPAAKPATFPKIAAAVLLIVALVIVAYFVFGTSEPEVVATAPAPKSTDGEELEAPALLPHDAGNSQFDATPRATFQISITAVPAQATIELDGQVVATGEYSAIMDGDVHELRLAADGYVPRRFTISPGHPPPQVVRLQPLASQKRPQIQPKDQKKPPGKGDRVPENGTKPFGSDNLNPWGKK